MLNVKLETKGSILHIEVDLDKDFGPSKSGKTIIVASTRGAVTLQPSGVKLGLNVYKARKA